MSTLVWIVLTANVLAVYGTSLVHVPCDDQTVEKLSRLAVTYINEDRQTGYKFALNRITNIQAHEQGPAGKVYYLDLDVLETKCHVLSPKSWKRCPVRPFMETQISGRCNTTVLHSADGFSYLYSYDCTLVPDPPEKLRVTCPVCPLLLPVDSDDAVFTMRTAILKHNSQSTFPFGLSVHAITRASRQTSPVPATFVEFTIQECATAEAHECETGHQAKDPVGFCVGEVFGSVQRDVKVSCEIFRPQTHVVSPTQHKDKTTTVPKSPSNTIDTAPGPSLHVQLADPVFQVLPAGPVSRLAPEPSASASSESSSVSSEEQDSSVRAVRPPLNFRFGPLRHRRQIPNTTAPSHTPVFMSLFPSAPSPFRSCPGASRFTTV